MCSGNGSNFENIVRTVNKHEVVLMIHNKKECGAARRATNLGIPHVHIKSADEDQIIMLLKAWRVDLIILAGWMKVISPEFIEAFPKKIINLHPSLLPKYKGLHAIEQALDSKDKVTGCSVHWVNEELDGGEVIKQQEVPILPDDDLKTLTKRIQRAEYGLLPDVINSI